MSARVWLSVSVCLAWYTGRASGGCFLPPHPSHGRHYPHGGGCRGANKHAACSGTPGTLAPEEWMLFVRCDPGYEPLDPRSADVLSVCIDGVWSYPKLPRCVIPTTKGEQRRCIVPNPPPNTQYRTLNTECGGENLPPGSHVPHDCIIIPDCAPGFRRRDDKGECLTHCNNGVWNPLIPNDFCIEQSTGMTVPESTESPTVASTSGCALPNPSASRKFCSLNDGCAEHCDFYNKRCLVSPNSGVSQVKVVCAQGYTTLNPTNNNIAVCLRDTYTWFPPIPECIKLCRPLKSEMLLLTCRYGTNIVDCTKHSFPNTTVSLECAPTFSEYSDLAQEGEYRRIHTCKPSGEWSHNLPLCKAACGVFNSAANKKFTSVIVNGTEAMLGFFPWHAGLYLSSDIKGEISWNQSCGGSLITDRFVLTAAHCVYNVVNDTSGLRIALGKYYRSWYHDEPYQKKVNVSAISISPQYEHATFIFDIALVLLSERIEFGAYIMPVCHDFDSATNYFQNSDLYVVGWGKTDNTDNANSSDVLLYNTVRVLGEDECRVQVPSFFTLFEKICAIKNNSVSVTQQGDSGGGLTAVYKDKLHYIVGIVSSKSDDISIFTKIKWKQHIEWMESEMRQLENYYGI